MKFAASVTKQPRKKRLALYAAPLHLKRKLVSVHVSKELRKKLGKRSLPAHKGDKVKILRGKFAGVSGKVVDVNVKDSQLHVEGAVIRKAKASKKGADEFVALDPSNVMLLETERKFDAKK